MKITRIPRNPNKTPFPPFIYVFCLAVLGRELRLVQTSGKHCYTELYRSLMTLILKKNVKSTYISFRVQMWGHKTRQKPQIQYLRWIWDKIAQGWGRWMLLHLHSWWVEVTVLGETQSSTCPKCPWLSLQQKTHPLWSHPAHCQPSMLLSGLNDPTILCIESRFYTHEIRGNAMHKLFTLRAP